MYLSQRNQAKLLQDFRGSDIDKNEVNKTACNINAKKQKPR